MTVTATSRLEPTERQLSFMYRLAGERLVPRWGTCGEERIETLGAHVEDTRPDRRTVSQMIDWLQRQPRDPAEQPEPREDSRLFDSDTLEIGVYELDGTVYVVTENRARTHKYAKRAVEVVSDRVTASGRHVKIDFEYAAGAVKKLRPEHKMSLKRAREFAVEYGQCIRCGRELKVAQSVERMLGPVCVKYFS